MQKYKIRYAKIQNQVCKNTKFQTFLYQKHKKKEGKKYFKDFSKKDLTLKRKYDIIELQHRREKVIEIV